MQPSRRNFNPCTPWRTNIIHPREFAEVLARRRGIGFASRVFGRERPQGAIVHIDGCAVVAVRGDAEHGPRDGRRQCETIDLSGQNKRARWVGNKLIKVWDGHAWVSPEERFGEVRKRKSEKADTETWDAEMASAQAELARALDTETLRGRLGHKVCTVLDIASSDSILGEIRENLGFAGQYAVRTAGKEVRAAVVALNAALAEEGRAAA